MATACEGHTALIRGDEDPYTCPESFGCGYYTILPTESASVEEGWLRYACTAESWSTNTVVRTLPSGYLTSTPATVRTIAVASASPTTDQTSTTASSAAAATTTTDKSISGGAIGGIVVGCIAAVAIIALLFFRKKIMACFGRNKPHIDDGPAWSPVGRPVRFDVAAVRDVGGARSYS